MTVMLPRPLCKPVGDCIMGSLIKDILHAGPITGCNAVFGQRIAKGVDHTLTGLRRVDTE